MTWLASNLAVLASQGWAAVVLFGIGAATAITLILSFAAIAWRYFRPLEIAEAIPKNVNAEQETDTVIDPEAAAPDKVAYNDLIAFSMDSLIPACDALREMQGALVSELCDQKSIAELAYLGLNSSENYELNGYPKDYMDLVLGMTQSPGPILFFEELMDCIHNLEKGSYRSAVEQTAKLASEIEHEINQGSELRHMWEAWRNAHNSLIDAFIPIQRDSRFPRLLRPARPSRWGNKIPPIPPEHGRLSFLSPSNIAGKTQPRTHPG